MKKIKGWAVMDDKGRPMVILIGAKLQEMFYLDSWGPYETAREKTREVVISFPTKKNKKKHG